ncbi:MAG: hypothetical protein JRI35_10050, partial [Deltaproteobacteria bacterium]|nr:hypothetical protein [Deltaproteobacteria bacterium]
GDPTAGRVSRFVDLIYEHLIDLKDDGSFCLNQEYFDYCTGLKMVKESKWKRLFCFPPRKPESEIQLEYCDLAMAIQKVTEEIILKLAQETKRLTNSSNLCLAGGVALNCVANGLLLRKRFFDNLWIQPAAGDAGGALGAALTGYYLYFDKKRKANPADSMQGSYLGPQYYVSDIEVIVRQHGAVYERYGWDELYNRVADLLAEGNVIGWFQGRMEWGPRALGNRSILADARNPQMQKKLNLKIKYREGFRPFAPSVLYEDVKEYFEQGFYSPYMLLLDHVHSQRRNPLPEGYYAMSLKDRLYYPRSDIPAITHLDYSARLQTVHKETNPRYHELISAFKAKTGYGVIVNTSFNVRGEPIVCRPDEAYNCFMRTEMDYLVIENYLFDKTRQPEWTLKKDGGYQYG